MSLIRTLLELDTIDPELYEYCLNCACGEEYRFESGGWLASYKGAYREHENCPVCGRPLSEMLTNVIEREKQKVTA